MPNPMPTGDYLPNGQQLMLWFFRLSCGGTISGSAQNSYRIGQVRNCDLHMDRSPVERLETDEEVEEHYLLQWMQDIINNAVPLNLADGPSPK